MRKLMLTLPVLAAAIGVYSLNAQPPGDRKAPPAGEKGQPGERRPERKIDPQVEAWVKMLAEKITDPHDEIRDGARAGLVAAGRTSLPVLRPMMDSDDGAKAGAARKLVETIELMQQQQRAALAGPTPAARTENAPRGNGNPERRPGNPGEPGGRNPLEAVLDDLGLNDKERKKVDDIHEALREKMRGLMEQVQAGTLDREKAREQRREIHETMMKAMKEALTEEQFAKFEDGMKKMGPPRGEGRPDRE